jgi:hypothetical protein
MPSLNKTWLKLLSWNQVQEWPELMTMLKRFKNLFVKNKAAFLLVNPYPSKVII